MLRGSEAFVNINRQEAVIKHVEGNEILNGQMLGHRSYKEAPKDAVRKLPQPANIKHPR
jgi:hypothetical protein